MHTFLPLPWTRKPSASQQHLAQARRYMDRDTGQKCQTTRARKHTQQTHAANPQSYLAFRHPRLLEAQVSEGPIVVAGLQANTQLKTAHLERGTVGQFELSAGIRKLLGTRGAPLHRYILKHTNTAYILKHVAM
eukprot:SAG31_NODE_8624_length_1418_cov_1.069750_2_plen_134_part_00